MKATRRLTLFLVAGLVVVAGCLDAPGGDTGPKGPRSPDADAEPNPPEPPDSGPEPDQPPPSPPPPSPPPPPTPPPPPAPPSPGQDDVSSFPPGIYYLVPGDDGSFDARLTHSEDALDRTFEVFPVGYDIQPTKLVYGDSGRQLFVVAPDGQRTVVRLQDIHSIGRPSLSPDGTRVAVQALEGDAVIGTSSEDLNIYIVELGSGETTRVSHRPINEESPVWVPGSGLVAYSSFDPDAGVHLHFVNAETGAEVRTIHEGGELHVGVSKDGTLVVQGPTLRVFDVSDGGLVADLGEAARSAVQAAGYTPMMGRGGFPDDPTFPLSATFSPEGDRLVFDGAVTDGEREGIVVAVMGLDGSGFRLVSDLIPVDATFSNQHNFSQVDPRWV